MYGFRHVSRRRGTVDSGLRPDDDPQSKLKATNIFTRISKRLKMRALLFFTLGLTLLGVVWQATAAGTTPGLRLHLGAQGTPKFSIGADRFYINDHPTRLISCECAFEAPCTVFHNSCRTVRWFAEP